MNSLRLQQCFKEKRTHKRLFESNSELKGSKTTLNQSNNQDRNDCNVDDVQYCQTFDVKGAYETEDDDGELHYFHSSMNQPLAKINQCHYQYCILIIHASTSWHM
jgi:hypothetical protein